MQSILSLIGMNAFPLLFFLWKNLVALAKPLVPPGYKYIVITEQDGAFKFQKLTTLWIFKMDRFIGICSECLFWNFEEFCWFYTNMVNHKSFCANLWEFEALKKSPYVIQHESSEEKSHDVNSHLNLHFQWKISISTEE